MRFVGEATSAAATASSRGPDRPEPAGRQPGVAAPIRTLIDALPASKIREVSRAGMGRADVLPLWFGEPDRPTPDFICEAAARALKEGHTFYTPNRGIPELREALASYMSDLYNRAVDRERITVTASGMNAIMIAMQCLVDPGDNVVITTPLWPNIAETVHIMGGQARRVPLDDAGDGGWSLDLDRLRVACDGRTRAVFINSPNNPTGWMMPGEQQQELLAFCREQGVWLVADEVYARVVFDRRVAPSFLDRGEPDDPLIVINSFSKAWAMTGWRLGWITHPARLGSVFEKMNEFNIAGPPAFAQHAGVVALREGEPFIADTNARYREGRDLVCARLGAMGRVRAPVPEAAFYAFFAVEGMDDSLGFAKRLVEEAGIGLAPGVAFGPSGEGHLRLCFAASSETLERASDRLEQALR
jgi:aspartate aminotransferase